MALDTTYKVLPPFLRLPRELHLEIVRHLTDKIRICRGACYYCKETNCEYGIDWSICQVELPNIAVFGLRTTCRYFRYMIPAPSSSVLHELAFLSYDFRRLDLLACKYCERLRPRSKFSMHQRNARRTYKYCADCAFARPALYGYGNQMKMDKELWVSCLICKEVKKGEEAGVESCRRLCRQCCQDRGCQKQGTKKKYFGERVRRHAYSKSPGFAGAWLRSQAEALAKQKALEDGKEEEDDSSAAEWKAWFD